MAGGSRRKKVGPTLDPVPFGLLLNPSVLTLLQKAIASFRTSGFALSTTAKRILAHL